MITCIVKHLLNNKLSSNIKLYTTEIIWRIMKRNVCNIIPLLRTWNNSDAVTQERENQAKFC